MFSVNEVFSDIKQSIQVKVCHVAIDLALIAVVDLVRLEEGKPCCKPKVYNFEKFADYIKKTNYTGQLKCCRHGLILTMKN